MTARRLLAGVVATAALLTGCQDAPESPPRIKPISPTEPTVPTPRAPRTPTAAPPTTTTPPRPVPPPAQVLPADNGYVFIQTKSGKTRCQLDTAEVGCEAPFTDAPTVDGAPANGVRLSAGGRMDWVVGNLGAIPAVTLDYRTYRAVGWTIEAGEDGTRFTNDETRHGMVVAVQGVETF